MPERCVAARCDNTADPTKGISIHAGTEVEEAPSKRERRMVSFIVIV